MVYFVVFDAEKSLVLFERSYAIRKDSKQSTKRSPVFRLVYVFLGLGPFDLLGFWYDYCSWNPYHSSIRLMLRSELRPELPEQVTTLVICESPTFFPTPFCTFSFRFFQTPSKVFHCVSFLLRLITKICEYFLLLHASHPDNWLITVFTENMVNLNNFFLHHTQLLCVIYQKRALKPNKRSFYMFYISMVKSLFFVKGQNRLSLKFH